MDDATTEVTQMLNAIKAGDPEAPQKLLTLVYNELRRMAAAKMAHEPHGHTLQATSLVHEAWLRMGADHQPQWQSRAHFFGAAAEAMRRILIDHARKLEVRKKHGLGSPEELHESRIVVETPESELLRLDEVLDRLALIDAEVAGLVKLRYFVGLKMAEATEIMGIPLSRGEKHWTFAKAWLRDALKREQ